MDICVQCVSCIYIARLMFYLLNNIDSEVYFFLPLAAVLQYSLSSVTFTVRVTECCKLSRSTGWDLISGRGMTKNSFVVAVVFL